MAAVAVANTSRIRILFNSDFIRQTIGVFQPDLQVDYLIFDFGARSGAIVKFFLHPKSIEKLA
jgi:outer membrane protein